MTAPRHGNARAFLAALYRSGVLLTAGLLFSACAIAADWRWQDVARVVAMSDVHGAHAAFQRTLRASGLLDDQGRWRGGGAHLVITGDLLDRGPDSRAVMDLLMRLEGEAIEAGGRVHVLLGNHEVMNLVGDLRYVSGAEYAAFAADEVPGERDYWYRQFVARAGLATDAAGAREEFDRRHPPGFFAHRRAFRSGGKYGAWLLMKPLLVVIDGTAFVHGGLSPLVGEIGLDGVNGGMLARLREYLAAVETLTEHGLLQPGDSFYNYERILEALPAEADRPAELDAAIDTVKRLDQDAIHDSNSPLWYRGTVGCSPIVEAGRLAPALATLQADRVVIGHTPTITRGVLSRLDGRILEIDTGMLKSYYGGIGHALVIDGGRLTVVDENGAMSDIERDPRLNDAGSLTSEALEAILRDGELVVGDERPIGGRSVSVQSADRRFSAVFYPAGKGGTRPELAAYRLDRLLDLYMVPVTVARTVNGDAGSLQYLPDELTNEMQRRESRAGTSAWCPLQDQWTAMYRFDTLAYKSRRSAEQIQYHRGTWQLIISGHADAFGTGRGKPPYLRSVDVTMNDAWRGALATLTDERLDASLGELLDRGQMRALKRRRDALLAP